MEVKDRTGQMFGKLTVIALVGRDKHGNAAWLCRCECGKEIIRPGHILIRKSTRSCGCSKLEFIGKAHRKHGEANRGINTSREYRAWVGMRERCRNRNNHAFHRYGGRGIKVSPLWDDFNRFKQDMGTCPDGMSIDRINNNGDYEPGNCRWATSREQNNNRNNNHRITFDGVTKTLAQWARHIGVSRRTVRYHVSRGRVWKDKATGQWQTQEILP